jgi:hypothetical protein
MMTVRRAALLSPLLAVAGVASVLAADPTPTNVFAAVGIDVVHLDPSLTHTLGSFASVYVSLMNGAVLAGMILFMWSSFRHVIRGVKDSHESGTNAYGAKISSQQAFVDTLYSVAEAGAVTVIVLFMIINGANLFLKVASGSQGMFSVSSTELLPKLVGPVFAGVAAGLQSFASLGIILLGAGVAVWKGLGVLREDFYGTQKGSEGSMNPETMQMSGGSSGKPALHRTQALIREIAFVMALTVLGYIVIRQGPAIVLSFLSGLSSVIPSLPPVPVPSAIIRIFAAFA